MSETALPAGGPCTVTATIMVTVTGTVKVTVTVVYV